MIQEVVAFFEFVDAHPSLGTALQVGTIIFLYVTYRKGQKGRARLHEKVECVDGKVDSLRSDFDIHKSAVEVELRHLNGHVVPTAGDD